MNLNKVFLIGRLTQDPENKVLPSGQSITTFSLATTRFFTDKNNQKQQQTEFHNIVLFNKLADIANQYLKKGSLVFIEGRLHTRSWQDQNGNKKSKTEIIAERLQLGPKTLSTNKKEPVNLEDIPVIEEEEEINLNDIPF